MVDQLSGVSILVRATWDAEAKVWVATSDDVPGLITEAETPNDLAKQLQILIPELLEENDAVGDEGPVEVPLFVMSEQLSKVRLRASA